MSNHTVKEIGNRIYCDRCGKDITEEVTKRKEAGLSQYGILNESGRMLDIFCVDCYFIEIDLAIKKYILELDKSNSKDILGDIIHYTKYLLSHGGSLKSSDYYDHQDVKHNACLGLKNEMSETGIPERSLDV